MSDRLDVGDKLPDIALEMPDGQVRPSDFEGGKLVIWFYPKDDTPGCTTEAKDFTALADEFAGAGAALLGVSRDPPAKHRKFAEKHDLAVPLATDPQEHGLADALGVWGKKSMYGKWFMGMERTTFLVDAEGRISRVWRKVKVKGHAAEVLEAARAL